jgi:bifunctional DNase/RNase
MIEMMVDNVRMGTVNTQRVLILKEKGGQHHLSIVLSAAEADPIITGLKNRSESHPVGYDNAASDKAGALPLTHDLVSKIIEAYNGKVKMAVINTTGKDRYYALLIIDAGGNETRFDCRTSDAIALAVRANAPVFIEESALESGSAPAKARERSEERNLIATDNIKCPECGCKTTIRTSTKGLNAGKKFHVCNNYPRCKGKVSIQYKSH